MAKKAPVQEKTQEPLFSRKQLMQAKTLGFAADVLSAVLKEDVSYTKKQASELVNQFMNREV